MSRPPRSAVRAAVRESLADLRPGDAVTVALSGGPDSLALLAAAVPVAGAVGLRAQAVVVDHGLQPGSADVARRAAEQARILGCPTVRVMAVDVPRGPGRGGPEAAARSARYEALAGASRRFAEVPEGSDDGARRAAVVLLGHTRDDQAETVLLGLARGSGPRSLAGMPKAAGVYRRPLLDLPRDLVARAAAEAAADDPRLTPWQDPHNRDPAYARARVRGEVLPALRAALGPGVVTGLARTAALARQDADALDGWAERVWASLDPPAGTRGLPVAPLVEGDDVPPDAVVARVVRRYLLHAGCPAGSLTSDHVRRVVCLLGPHRPGVHVALPGGLRAQREAAAVVVRA